MKRVSAIRSMVGEKKYLELQVSLAKLPKTTEGIAEAHARRMAFYGLHECHPAVKKDALERCVPELELEIQAKVHGVPLADLKKAVKAAKKVLTTERTKEATKGMLINRDLACALRMWGIANVMELHLRLRQSDEFSELNCISSDQHDEARERIEMQEAERQLHWDRKWTAAEMPELKAKYEAELNAKGLAIDKHID